MSNPGTVSFTDLLLLETRVRSDSVTRAALFVHDALDSERRIHPLPGSKRRLAFLLRFHSLNVVRVAVLGSLVLTFFERPLWCKKPHQLVSDPCSSPMYPAYPISYLSEGWNLFWELFCYLPVLVDNVLLLFAQGAGYFSIPRQKLCFIALVATAVDMVYAYNTPYWWYRGGPYFRIVIYVMYSHAVRSRLKQILLILPELFSIFFLVACYLIFFAWFGVLLFADSAEGEAFFDGLCNGVWSLLVLMTSSNFPDVMMPAYSSGREKFIFFLVFVCLGVFFFMNVVTASVFNTFCEHKKQKEQEKEVVREENLKEAFKLLCNLEGVNADGAITAVGVIEQSSMRELFDELNHFHDIAYITTQIADAVLDVGAIHFDDFKRIIVNRVFKNTIGERPNRPPLLERKFKGFADARCWQALKHACGKPDSHLNRAIDVVMVLSVVLTFAESYSMGLISGHHEHHHAAIAIAHGGWSLLSYSGWELYVTLFFVAEVAIKIMALGLDEYFTSLYNQFDFCITLVTTSVTIYVLLPNDINSTVLIRYVAILRLGRMLRLLAQIDKFRVIARTFVLMLPEAVGIVKILLCAMYLFSVAGTQLFGGVINTDPNSPYSAPVAASDFGASDYYANNFNDMPSGFVLLFELLVVNNWYVLVDGFGAAVGKWSASFFVTWYVIGVNISLNIVLAFVMDSFFCNVEQTKSCKKILWRYGHNSAKAAGSLEFSEVDTVDKMQTRIAEQANLDVERIMLMYQGAKMLEKNKTLQDYGIGDESTLDVVGKGPPCGDGTPSEGDLWLFRVSDER